MNKRRAKRRFIIGCLTPAIILVTIFMIIPTINVFYMSLFKWGGLSNNKKLVWFDNFKILFEDDNFLRAMQNTILLVVVVTIITLFFAIIFASILSREKIKGQNFFRIVFYIPLYYDCFQQPLSSASQVFCFPPPCHGFYHFYNSHNLLYIGKKH